MNEAPNLRAALVADLPEATGARLCLGVAGGTASGKTSVCEEIVRRFGEDHVALLRQDSYYRDLSGIDEVDRASRNFDHPTAIDSGLLLDHLLQLLRGSRVPVPVYDFAHHMRLARVQWVEPRFVILVEGTLVLADEELRRLMDVRIFVDTDPDLRLIRRLLRDIEGRGRRLEGVVEQYLGTVRPMHLELVEPSKRWADLVVPGGAANTVALDLICSHVERHLETHALTALSPARHNRRCPPQ